MACKTVMNNYEKRVNKLEDIFGLKQKSIIETLRNLILDLEEQTDFIESRIYKFEACNWIGNLKSYVLW